MHRALTAGMLAVLMTAGGLLGPANAGSRSDWTLGGRPCELIEVPLVAPPFGITSCPGVRPGAIVRSDKGQCSFNFLFNGSDGRKYIGTAGHCILGSGTFSSDAGEMSWAPGAGAAARNSANSRIGEFAYAILEDPKDFALIRLDPGVASSPQMCHFGGPTGINNDLTSSTTVVQHYGNGIGVGLVPARSGVAFGMPHPDHVYAQAAIAPGDSGSGMITNDGRAVGVIVTVGIHSHSIGTGGIDAGIAGITRIQPQLDRAAAVLGIQLSLETAPLL